MVAFLSAFIARLYGASIEKEIESPRTQWSFSKVSTTAVIVAISVLFALIVIAAIHEAK